MRKKSSYLYIFLLSFVLFTSVLWGIKIMQGTIPLVDQWTRDFVRAMADSNIYFLFRLITELGSGTFLTPFTIVMGFVLWYIFRDWLVGVIFAGGTILSYGINVFILLGREDPHFKHSKVSKTSVKWGMTRPSPPLQRRFLLE
ncbi:hypothetical protein [Virgibacillus necropolis]|uniref:Uncharacterized protein n=1 Tax=Virgibacillus necropolis TaxID=163877 RepID=A0A221MFY0_9BACI|nr:hypothetical protein [Virgibacillus necropolis]ASN06578.1 hypothetical protein CFK40_16915 [Virgibacillus necropolis]